MVEIGMILFAEIPTLLFLGLCTNFSLGQKTLRMDMMIAFKMHFVFQGINSEKWLRILAPFYSDTDS
ncbi:MAG: hypothetical protein APR55_04235 [Methanolinea sp. SDB]|nr:MAG: hypothetical protein APR55_04235 [Methanolinea sp. SDB]